MSASARRSQLRPWKRRKRSSGSVAPAASASRTSASARSRSATISSRLGRGRSGRSTRSSTAASAGCTPSGPDAPEEADGRAGAEAGAREPQRPRGPVGHGVHGLERQAPPHPDPLRAAVLEGDARHDVAGGALQEDALAARHRAHRVAQRARVVRRVGDDLDARRDGVRAVPDDRRHGAAVLADRLQDGHAEVGHAVRVPADAPHHAVGVALAAVHGLVCNAEPPAHPGVFEALAGQAADLDDAAVQVLDVGSRRGVRLHHALAEGAVHRQAAGRRVVGVVPVEQDARAGGTGRSLDAVAQDVDLGRLDGQRVDAADDDPRRPVVERGCRHLERAEAALGPAVAPHHAHHRQAEGRVDVQPRGARAEAACSTQVVVLLGSDSRTRSAPMLPESGTEQEPIPLDLRRGVVYVRCPRDCKGLRERRGRTP